MGPRRLHHPAQLVEFVTKRSRFTGPHCIVDAVHRGGDSRPAMGGQPRAHDTVQRLPGLIEQTRRQLARHGPNIAPANDLCVGITGQRRFG